MRNWSEVKKRCGMVMCRLKSPADVRSLLFVWSTKVYLRCLRVKLYNGLYRNVSQSAGDSIDPPSNVTVEYVTVLSVAVLMEISC